MTYKPEHVVDLESGAIVLAVHPEDQVDTITFTSTLLDAQVKLGAVKEVDAPGNASAFELVAATGYHSRRF